MAVSAKGKSTLDEVLKEFESTFGKDKVAGTTCNVTDYSRVQALWNVGSKKFGKMDIWINNAGYNLWCKVRYLTEAPILEAKTIPCALDG